MIVIPLRIKVQLTAAIIATLLLPFPAEAAPYKVPYCINGGQTIRQVDAATIICRNLTPLSFGDVKAVDEIWLYRFHGGTLETGVIIKAYGDGRKLVTILLNHDPTGRNSITTQLWLRDRRFDEWAADANPDLLEQRRSDVTLLLDTLESAPLSRPSF